MAVEEAVHARQLVPAQIAVSPEILTAIKTLFLRHEGVGIFLELFPDLGVSLEEFLQRGVMFHEVLVIYERGIFTQLLGDFRMLVEELVHAGEFTMGNIIIAGLAVAVFTAIKAVFLMHEDVGIGLELSADLRMLLQILLQVRAVLQKLLIVDQPRLRLQLSGG